MRHIARVRKRTGGVVGVEERAGPEEFMRENWRQMLWRDVKRVTCRDILSDRELLAVFARIFGVTGALVFTSKQPVAAVVAVGTLDGWRIVCEVVFGKILWQRTRVGAA